MGDSEDGYEYMQFYTRLRQVSWQPLCTRDIFGDNEQDAALVLRVKTFYEDKDNNGPGLSPGDQVPGGNVIEYDGEEVLSWVGTGGTNTQIYSRFANINVNINDSNETRTLPYSNKPSTEYTYMSFTRDGSSGYIPVHGMWNGSNHSDRGTFLIYSFPEFYPQDILTKCVKDDTNNVLNQDSHKIVNGQEFIRTGLDVILKKGTDYDSEWEGTKMVYFFKGPKTFFSEATQKQKYTDIYDGSVAIAAADAAAAAAEAAANRAAAAAAASLAQTALAAAQAKAAADAKAEAEAAAAAAVVAQEAATAAAAAAVQAAEEAAVAAQAKAEADAKAEAEAAAAAAAAAEADRKATEDRKTAEANALEDQFQRAKSLSEIQKDRKVRAISNAFVMANSRADAVSAAEAALIDANAAERTFETESSAITTRLRVAKTDEILADTLLEVSIVDLSLNSKDVKITLEEYRIAGVVRDDQEDVRDNAANAYSNEIINPMERANKKRNAVKEQLKFLLTESNYEDKGIAKEKASKTFVESKFENAKAEAGVVFSKLTYADISLQFYTLQEAKRDFLETKKKYRRLKYQIFQVDLSYADLKLAATEETLLDLSAVYNISYSDGSYVEHSLAAYADISSQIIAADLSFTDLSNSMANDSFDYFQNYNTPYIFSQDVDVSYTILLNDILVTESIYGSDLSKNVLLNDISNADTSYNAQLAEIADLSKNELYNDVSSASSDYESSAVKVFEVISELETSKLNLVGQEEKYLKSYVDYIQTKDQDTLRYVSSEASSYYTNQYNSSDITHNKGISSGEYSNQDNVVSEITECTQSLALDNIRYLKTRETGDEVVIANTIGRTRSQMTSFDDTFYNEYKMRRKAEVLSYLNSSNENQKTQYASLSRLRNGINNSKLQSLRDGKECENPQVKTIRKKGTRSGIRGDRTLLFLDRNVKYIDKL